MSLRRALSALPDDRDTVAAVREVVAFLSLHPGEPMDVERVTRSTGVSSVRVEPVMCALAEALVIDCDGDPRLHEFTYQPDAVLSLEVRRFLKVAGGVESRLHRGVDRFRGRYNSGN